MRLHEFGEWYICCPQEVELLCNKSTRNVVLAIDISLNSSGVCFWNAGASSPECTDKIENPVGGDIAPKLQHIYDRVIGYLDIPGVTAVALEDIFVGANPKTTTWRNTASGRAKGRPSYLFN
jgi:hypothetical protein